MWELLYRWWRQSTCAHDCLSTGRKRYGPGCSGIMFTWREWKCKVCGKTGWDIQ